MYCNCWQNAELRSAARLAFKPFRSSWYLIRCLDGDPTIHDGSGDYRSIDKPEE